MSVLFSLGFAMVGSSVYGLTKELNSPYFKTKRKIRKAIRRAKMAVQKLEGSDPKKIEFPKFLSLEKTDYGWYCKYLMPVGVTQYHCYERLDILEGALNAEINMWMEGQIWHMKIYNHHIPDSIQYKDVLKKRKEGTILLGLSRKGVECIDFKEVVNPHIMLGGMSGMGKSNAMNVILTQLLELEAELYLIDPKRVEFNIYENVSKVKGLAKDVATGTKLAHQVTEILKERETVLDRYGFQNIHAYNSFADDPLPYIFLVVDEFSDFEGIRIFWECIGAIARKGRALGVHLIMATQRPSADVLPPAIKANMGIKIAFRVSTLGNSKILLENNKAMLLPDKQGRAILDMGEQREMQIPYLDRKVHESLLKQHKGVNSNVHGSRRDNDVRSSRGGIRSEGIGETVGDYRLE